VPESKDEKEDDSKVVKFIDDRMIETPSIALGSILKETLRMGEKSKESLNAAMDGVIEKSKEKIELQL
jgi:phosphate:Na+ symporter